MAVPPAGRATLDFFAAQGVARRRTAALVVSFSLAVAAVAAIVWAAVAVLADWMPYPGLFLTQGRPLRADLLLPTSLAVLGVVGAGSLYHGLRLSGGGEALAELLGGERIRADTTDPADRRLLNVVEEMALAAGMPVPGVYVLRREGAINAFAAGFQPDRAVVAVTQGALDRLNRDELQGVVAHELSHVLNADTRLDLRLMAAVGGLSAVGLIGRLLLRGVGRSRRGRGAGPVLLLGLALVVAGGVGTFFGSLVRYAVARQREWLADASAVQFTRNPEGLAGALRKIAAEGSRLTSPRAPEAAHLFFAAATASLLESLFSTHPPVEERIARLVPHAATAGPGPAAARVAPGARPAPPGVAGFAQSGSAGSLPDVAQLDAAARLLREVPAALRSAAADPFGARAVVVALLLEGDPALRGRQLAGLGRRDPALASAADAAGRWVEPFAAAERLALLELALPALDRLSPAQAQRFAEALGALAEADGTVTPFEQAVLRAALRRLGRPAAAVRPRLRRPDDAAMECLELLSALAWVGGRDAAAAEDAFRTGLLALGLDGAWRILPRDRIGRAAFDRALARLDQATVELKGRILAACGAAARADGQVTAREAEVLRAVAAAFGIPSPLTAAAPSRPRVG